MISHFRTVEELTKNSQLTMTHEIKVFISSVQCEFAKERRQLCNYIRNDSLLGRFFEPFIFEDMPASEVSAQKAYLTQAAECHVYLGILGTQYGYEDAEGVSPTEREYDTATDHFAHRLTYTLDTDTPRHPKEKAFINKVEQNVVRRAFTTYEELRTAVYNSLIDYLVQKDIIRQVPFDAAAHPVATFNDIDPERVRTFVNKAKEKRNFPLTFADGIGKILSSIHVLTDDGRLTNSALLLFAKDPQQFFRTSEVRCAQFYGFTVQKLREMHSSEPTNPVIAHPLFLAGYIEHLGTGTTDMITACEDYGLHAPEFRQAEDFRTIIYRKKKVSDLGEKVLEFNRKVSDLDEKVTKFDEKVSKFDEKVTNLGEKVTNLGEKATELDEKSNRAQQKSNRVRLTAKQRKVLEFCDEMPRTAQEILDMLGVKNQNKTRQQYTTKLVLMGVLRPTTTAPNDPNRKYITAHDEC